MDWSIQRETITEFVKKYRWAVLVLLIGLLLMFLPEDNSTAPSPADQPEKIQENQSLQYELEEILSRLDGAGKVKVLLSTESGNQTHYQTDHDQSYSQNTQDRKSETVIITSSDRNENGLIQRIDAPIYRGAVILCQGGDSPAVRLAIVDAVSTATGLTSDKIAVLKMK